MILVETVMVALVAARVWQFLARDSITEGLRQKVERWQLLWEWLRCPWCSGTWLTIAVALVAYFAGLLEGSPWLVAADYFAENFEGLEET